MSSAADDADTERARSYRRHQTWALALGAAFGPGRGRCPAPGQSFLIALFLDDLLVGTGLSRMAALETHEIVHSRDLANDGRWPAWGPKAAAEAGVGSVVGHRLFTTTDTLGAMSPFTPASQEGSPPTRSTTDRPLPLTLPSHSPKRDMPRTWRER